MTTRSKLAAAFLATASTMTVLAADMPKPEVTFGGYAVATGDYNKTEGVPSSSSFDLNAAKFGVTGKFDTVTGYASIYYNGGTNTTNLLDAYVGVDVGGGFTITGGKFLSYMGYEAFDIPNMAQISYANGALLGGPVPAYHSGVKIDYSSSDFGAGVAVVDSIYGPTFDKGDSDLHQIGIEAYVTYKGIKDTTIWFGVADDAASSTVVYDLWASYALNKTDSVGAEFLIRESVGYNWLVAYTKGLTEKWSVTGRISGEKQYDDAGGAGYMKYTVSPSYSVNAHFLVRAELSVIDANQGAPTSTYAAVQSIFKF